MCCCMAERLLVDRLSIGAVQNARALGGPEPRCCATPGLALHPLPAAKTAIRLTHPSLASTVLRLAFTAASLREKASHFVP